MKLPPWWSILVLIAFIVIAIVLWKRDKRIHVVASNGKSYLVVPSHNQQEKANVLGKIDDNVRALLRAMNLPMNIAISENDDFREYVAFTMNKTDIRICLKSLDINTLMFVTMHELAHAFSKDIGHSREYWDLFASMIQKAIEIGVYVYQDFAKSPEPYCGETIESSPYKCPTCQVYVR